MKKTILILLAILSFCPALLAQTEKPLTRQQKDKFLEVAPPSLRPKLTLQQGLKLAENYIASEKIDVSSYWLRDAKFIVQPDSHKPGSGTPGWLFEWVHDPILVGNYVDIFVSLDGKCSRVPTM